ncbi:MAG: hypothetical protein HY328_10980 [Chloroflexi bacterium]|nr:hypothetical protein [Chloroflexota bacterium]
MAEYIYPTRVNDRDPWLKVMLDKWEASNRPRLCFPWILFDVNTISDHSFWLYMYYSYNQSDIPSLKGVIEYRIYVSNWGHSKFDGPDVYRARFHEPGKIWFLCERFEKICKINNEQLGLPDFVHKYNKRLGSTIRNSIPPVVCKAKLKIINSYGEIA